MSKIPHSPSAAFRDRVEAGQHLAKALLKYERQPQTWVLALPRGGVPVGAEIAKALSLPLDVCLVRKLGVPGQAELAMGAIASHGVQILNHDIIRRMNIATEDIQRVATAEAEELQRRDRTYRPNKPPLDIQGQAIILVDDGIATGSTLKAAISVLRQQQPQRIVVAVPVAPPSTVEELRQEVDEVVCLAQPDPLYSISLWYGHFDQTSDETVCKLLQQNRNSQLN
ncbi:phosphoribosyltransferase [Pseudanabaena sp. FACHB-2040]|uniref:phosphoribosyltransferase n=1 Tax=Pseudanabaena sp. FACHB-2040 TaxID=2692859 RepID=UPI0016899B82|nr:phosphoribosyltransferase [Pseudanabaena sp. FACHB-2040]MBD2258622.1 phosphoribosyltransferase [Pseudanabaena sp. FACHB-2040]